MERSPDPPDFDVRLLPAFVALAEELHFGRAGERLHLGQSALTRQVQRLEAQLGVELFERTTRTVDLTPAGRVMLDEARASIGSAARAGVLARAAARSEQARLRLAMSVDSEPFVRPLLDRVAELPGVPRVQTFASVDGDSLPMLRERVVELATVFAGETTDGHPDTSGLELLELASAEVRIALPAGDPLAARELVSAPDLADRELVMFERELGPIVFDALRERIAPDGYAAVRSIDGTSIHVQESMLVEAARTGAATPVTEDWFERARVGGLVLKPFAPASRITIQLAWAPPLAPLPRRLVDAIAELVRPSP